MSPNYRVVRISGIRIFGLLLYLHTLKHIIYTYTFFNFKHTTCFGRKQPSPGTDNINTQKILPVYKSYNRIRHGASYISGWRYGLRICKVAANILNKQTADKKWSSSLGLDVVLTTPHRKIYPCYETGTKASESDRFFGKI